MPNASPDSIRAPAARAAAVVGAGGGLGAALLAALRSSGEFGTVFALGRTADIALDYAAPDSIAAAAAAVKHGCEEHGCALELLIVATGFLHGSVGQPERGLANLDADYLAHVFAINTIGPALVMKHFLPLLPKSGRAVAGFVSARVGSIGDNALGGWYGYRASKAALNQLVKTAAIELTRRNSASVCVALHPGTVDTELSRPFAKTGLNVRPAHEAAAYLLRVLGSMTPADTGNLIDYQGHKLPF
jgi:NAD(P)-dependent dehydrogenase (short-subunit alcohol dehydrogenase family)